MSNERGNSRAIQSGAFFRIVFPLVLVLLTFLAGVIGYIWIEKCSLVDAIYMTIITISTVGFTEVHAFSPAGRIFTSVLIVFNITVVTVFLSNLIGSVTRGELHSILKYFKMNKQIEQLYNHVIICGLGRYGRQVAVELAKNGQPFVAIESDMSHIEMLENDNVLFLNGDATSDAVLEEAGIRKAKSIIISVSDDAENAYIVLAARQLNPNINIVARCLQPKSEKKLLRAGANHIVMPERIGGYYMASLAQNPEVVEFFNLISNMGGANINFEEVRCTKLKPEWRGITLESFFAQVKTQRVNILALHKPDGTYAINPQGSTVLSEDTTLVVLASKTDLEEFKQAIFG